MVWMLASGRADVDMGSDEKQRPIGKYGSSRPPPRGMQLGVGASYFSGALTGRLFSWGSVALRALSAVSAQALSVVRRAFLACRRTGRSRLLLVMLVPTIRIGTSFLLVPAPGVVIPGGRVPFVPFLRSS